MNRQYNNGEGWKYSIEDYRCALRSLYKTYQKSEKSRLEALDDFDPRFDKVHRLPEIEKLIQGA